MTTPIGSIIGGDRKATGLFLGTPNAIAGFSNVAALVSPASAASGTLVANTLKTILSLTGRGMIDWLAVAESSGAYTDRIKITVDGNVIYDSTKAMPGTGYGYVVLGSAAALGSGDYFVTKRPVYFDATFLVEVASTSASSTQTLYYAGETHA